MFTKNVFTQKDPIADLVKPMLEAQTQQRLEELKGNQKVLDKNKNNKLDAQDFSILRGEKKAVKEEEQVEEGWDDMMKAVKDRSGPQPSGGSGKKAGTRYGGSKQKDKPEQDDDKKKVKEEVEQVEERSLTPSEKADMEKNVKGMKKNLAGFKARYGERAKSVMYATATKAAKKD